jgi:hypothetical protein
LALIPRKYQSFDEFIKELKKTSPEEIIQWTKDDVKAFVENSIKPEFNQTLLVIEKKAKLLFEPSMHRFMEKGFSPAFIRACHEVVWIRGSIGNKISIIADCINTGDEIILVADHITLMGCTIDKIYCYVFNEEATKKLKANKSTKNVPIVSAHNLKLGDSTDIFGKLRILYISLPDPMDIDHSYDIYRGDFSLKPPELKNVLETCCREALGIEDLSFQDDEHLILPKRMQSMRMDIKNPRIINAGSNSRLRKMLDSIDFDYANLKLKAFYEDSRLQFSLIGCFPLRNLHKKETYPQDGCQFFEKNQCYINIIQCRISKVLRWKIICPLCIANYVERIILNQISARFIASLKDKGPVIVEKHDPVERQI